MCFITKNDLRLMIWTDVVTPQQDESACAFVFAFLEDFNDVEKWDFWWCQKILLLLMWGWDEIWKLRYLLMYFVYHFWFLWYLNKLEWSWGKSWIQNKNINQSHGKGITAFCEAFLDLIWASEHLWVLRASTYFKRSN